MKLNQEIRAKTAGPVLQSLTETFEVVRLFPLQEQHFDREFVMGPVDSTTAAVLLSGRGDGRRSGTGDALVCAAAA